MTASLLPEGATEPRNDEEAFELWDAWLARRALSHPQEFAGGFWVHDKYRARPVDDFQATNPADL